MNLKARAFFTLALSLGLSLPMLAGAAEITVSNDAQLREALRAIQPGTTLKIGPGTFKGGYELRGVAGVTVEGLDAANPPVFQGGGAAWHFSRCDRLTVRNLRTSGQTGNGLNFDNESGQHPAASEILIENVIVENVGPRGNRDGIKGSGLERLTIRGCKVVGWGGEAIDLVGCHDVLITNCRVEGKEGFSCVTGIQFKGGSSNGVIEKCQFINAGMRPVNVGGSTGRPYFRPANAKYEAKNITVRDNVFEGSPCAAAFVGVDGAEFANNTILFPTKWIFRILQENREDGMVLCRNVVIQNNRIVFNRSQVREEINISDQTKPETFKFSNNQWFAADRPQSSQPKLPVQEIDGRYGVDPRRKGEIPRE